jgi:hypothetical protein
LLKGFFGAMALLVVVGVLVLVVVATIALFLGWKSDERHYSVVVYASVMALVVTFLFLARRFARGALDWAVYRHTFAYLLYPSRILLSAGVTITLFALVYGLVDWCHAHPSWLPFHSLPLGSLVDSAVPPKKDDPTSQNPRSSGAAPTQPMAAAPPVKPDGQDAPQDKAEPTLLEEALDEATRAVHFSAVTFTTLGYGDVAPKGPMRAVSNLEAFAGALFLSMITAAMARQVLRK